MNRSENVYINVLGLMSGTSLDGLDLCLTRFNSSDYSDFEILKSVTISYANKWMNKLSSAHLLGAKDLLLLHNEFAEYCSIHINEFILRTNHEIHLIASHGHTVFHDPEHGLTTQIGNGAVIYANTHIKTICDFRSVDVAFRGQGAPLVPIGDHYLFSEYDSCLNLGGIANATFKTDNQIIAKDICFANMLLNHLTFKLNNTPYDFNGELGKSGEKIDSLLQNLNDFHVEERKSLAREQFEQFIQPLFSEVKVDHLTTAYHYVSDQIAHTINDHHASQILVTGGGAKNDFLVKLLKQKCSSKIVVPNEELIDFKEALIFGFLGLLRIQDKSNALSSVTHAEIDSIGGAIYG